MVLHNTMGINYNTLATLAGSKPCLFLIVSLSELLGYFFWVSGLPHYLKNKRRKTQKERKNERKEPSSPSTIGNSKKIEEVVIDKTGKIPPGMMNCRNTDKTSVLDMPRRAQRNAYNREDTIINGKSFARVQCLNRWRILEEYRVQYTREKTHTRRKSIITSSIECV